MPSAYASAADVFTTHEIARAAGVGPGEVQTLVASGAIGTIDGRFVATGEAVRAVRMLRGGAPLDRGIFRPAASARRSPARAFAASGALHVVVLAIVVMLTTMGVASAPEQTAHEPSPVRLVFLAIPGPGGGGGGGGRKQPIPAVRAELKGTAALRSPVPLPRPVTKRAPDPEPKKEPPPVRPEPVAKPAEPPPPPPTPPVPLPQVQAPVATVAADARDRAGQVSAPPAEPDSRGSGSGGGAGTGQGTGMGEGNGSGIGPGSGGGTGGGPYRAGSGITAPELLREVKPDYTEEARRRGVEGDVVLEIVVRSDGSVGDVRIVRGLDGGLDRRAVDAVRQWRFSPARRRGAAVDVIVEVAVEFKLR